MKTDPRVPSAAGAVPFVMAWSAVCSYGLLLMATQVLWLTYAPVTSQVHQVFGVSEGAVGDLAVVVPILYVLLGMQAGRWLDRHFTKTMVVGTGLVVAGALIRAVDAGSYAYALTGQIILSAGLPLFANAITKVPARYLAPKHHVRAISLLTASQVLGILVAASTGGWLYERGGLDLLVDSHAVLTVASGAVMLCSLAIRPRFAAPGRGPVARMSLHRNRQMCLLAGQAFIGLGLFNALATWLETIQNGFGNEGWGGPMVTVMTVAGVTGVVAALMMRAGYYMTLGGRRDNNGGIPIQLLFILVGAVVYGLSFLLIRSLSRYRELAADRAAALLTGRPSTLASALTKLSGDMNKIPEKDLRETASANHLALLPAAHGSSGFGALFSTHPSLDKRLAQLAKISAQLSKPE